MSIKTIRKRIKHAVFGAMISSGMMVAMSCTAVSSTGGGPNRVLNATLAFVRAPETQIATTCLRAGYAGTSPFVTRPRTL